VTDRGGTAPDTYETSGARGSLGEVALLRSQIAALEQLLDVHERTSIEQATRLEQTLREREELLAREREARDALLEIQAARDRALVEAKAERQRLYEVFMQAPAAIAVLEGPEHVFAVANPLYVELVGGREIAGMTVRQALPEIEGQGFLDLLHTVYTSGESYSASEMLVRLDRDQDGVLEDVYVDFVYQPMKTDRGETFGIMVHAVDVTGQVLSRREVEKKAEELARLTRDLERSNKELDQFAYVASHDLKAPLRGIANLTQWIEEDLGDKVTGESREHMQLLKGRVHRMEALIDGILAYSRAGRVRERPARVDVGALLNEVIELLAPPPETTIVVAPDMPVIETERVPLQQVFMNLIGNAIKYTRRADARIEVTAQAEGELYRFAIADNGPGIAPQYREKIWQIFQTLAPRDKVEGTGIGLSVVRKTVESRGGSAWLDSEPGRGSTFYFTWPKQQDITP
jgi:signal transduction histidine kinase